MSLVRTAVFRTHLQELLQDLEFQGKLAGDVVGQQGILFVVHLSGRAAVEQQVAIGVQGQKFFALVRGAGPEFFRRGRPPWLPDTPYPCEWREC